MGWWGLVWRVGGDGDGGVSGDGCGGVSGDGCGGVGGDARWSVNSNFMTNMMLVINL